MAYDEAYAQNILVQLNEKMSENQLEYRKLKTYLDAMGSITDRFKPDTDENNVATTVRIPAMDKHTGKEMTEARKSEVWDSLLPEIEQYLGLESTITTTVTENDE